MAGTVWDFTNRFNHYINISFRGNIDDNDRKKIEKVIDKNYQNNEGYYGVKWNDFDSNALSFNLTYSPNSFLKLRSDFEHEAQIFVPFTYTVSKVPIVKADEIRYAEQLVKQNLM
jgi:hypothetical protein